MSDRNTPADLPTPTLDLLQASLFFLMNRYVKQPQEPVARAIVDHLERLGRHPEIALCPVQREVYARLTNDWRWRLTIDRTAMH